MTIKIVITQTCDDCGESREIDPKYVENISIPEAAGGWRKVTNIKHMCVNCIEKRVNNKKGN